MIELDQVCKTYFVDQKPISALSDICLKINPGEIFGIIGRSGAGKSTLLRTLNLLERPTHGSIKLNGVELTTLSDQALRQQRQHISVIFQHFNLLQSRSVFDNVALPLEILQTPKYQIQQKVAELLAWVGLTERQTYFPDQLSGGQKQRVAIARALATQPSILLCDEATSALDPESTQDILALLKKINQTFNVTIILITHELTVVKQICQRMGFMYQGQMVEQAPTVELLAQPKLPLTRQFIKQSLHLPDQIMTQQPNTLWVQLTFIGDTSETPIISTLIKNYDLMVNIRQAQIEAVQDTVLGFTICELSGTPATLQAALAFLQSAKVDVEVLSHAA